MIFGVETVSRWGASSSNYVDFPNYTAKFPAQKLFDIDQIDQWLSRNHWPCQILIVIDEIHKIVCLPFVFFGTSSASQYRARWTFFWDSSHWTWGKPKEYATIKIQFQLVSISNYEHRKIFNSIQLRMMMMVFLDKSKLRKVTIFSALSAHVLMWLFWKKKIGIFTPRYGVMEKNLKIDEFRKDTYICSMVGTN